MIQEWTTFSSSKVINDLRKPLHGVASSVHSIVLSSEEKSFVDPSVNIKGRETKVIYYCVRRGIYLLNHEAHG
jgi:hypothetical protein